MMTALGKNIPILYLKGNTVFEGMTLELLQVSQPYTKPIPEHCEATPRSPLYHEMDTSRHRRCTCTALTQQKFTQEPTEMVLAPYFVWTSTSISTGTLGPFLWAKTHFILCQNKSVAESLGFNPCQRQTKFVLKPCWNLQEGKKETGYEQDQINIHLQACAACVWTNHFKIPHTWELIFQFPMTSLFSQYQ